MDITKKTVDELKAICYDLLVDKDRIIRNIALIQAEIEKRKEVKE